MCLHQSAVTFSDLSQNIHSAHAGYDMALFIICKLSKPHVNSHISQTPSYPPRLDSSCEMITQSN